MLVLLYQSIVEELWMNLSDIVETPRLPKVCDRARSKKRAKRVPISYLHIIVSETGSRGSAGSTLDRVLREDPRRAEKRLLSLDADNLNQVINGCDNIRDKAVVLLMANSGLRRSEAQT